MAPHTKKKKEKRSVPTASVSATITNSGYEPQQQYVTQGGSVIWTNNGTVNHTATADDGSFDTGPIAPGKSSQPITFNTPGSVDYHDEDDGSLHGQIRVNQS